MVQCNRRALADRISHEAKQEVAGSGTKIVDMLTADPATIHLIAVIGTGRGKRSSTL